MHSSWLLRRRVRPYVALVAVLACVDRVTGPTPNVAQSSPPPVRFVRVQCTADVRALTVSCPASLIISSDRIGAVEHGVRIVTGAPTFDGRTFAFDAALASTIAQPLGTTDGTTPDPNGVRAFFTIGPTVAQGSGSVDFTDAAGALLVDGIAAITAPNQPFYRYAGIIAPGETSVPRRWRFDVNGSVAVFTFGVDIDAAVPHPTGFIDVTPATVGLRRGRRATLTAVVRDVFGNPSDGAPVSWTSNPTSVATVDSNGVVTGAADGTATITATSTVAGVTRTGSAIVTVASASAATTIVSASSTTVVSGDSAIVVVQARTATGVNLTAGGDTIVLNTDAGVLSTVTDRGDGTYVAILRSTIARDVTVSGTIDGVAIPQHVTVHFVAGPPASMRKVAGDDQTAAVSTAVAVPPTVRITDANDNPVSGVTVTFVAANGGAVTGATAATNDSGVVSAGTWTLGAAAGADTLVATAGSLRVTFTATATATPGPAPTPPAPPGANTLAKRTGDNQTAPAGASVPIAPSVIVRDASGNPVARASIAFAVVSGGGTITGATQLTDTSGVATVGSWTLGTTVGANTLSATLASVSVTFTATAVAGAPATIVKTAGDGQSAQVSTPVPVAPSVAIRDAHGNPVAGVTVTFAVGSGGGSVTGASQVTDASGNATVGSWTLGPAGGVNNNSLIASTGGLSATFTASGTSAPPPPPVLHHFLVEASGGGPIAAQTAGVTFSIRITAQDASNNTVTAFTGTVDLVSNRTAASGLGTSESFVNGVLATHSVTLTQAGAGATITATRTGGAESGTSNAFTVNAGVVNHFVVEAAAGGPIGTQVAGQAFSIRVTARDQFDNTATGFSGTVSVSSSGTLSAGGGTSAAFTNGVLASHDVAISNAGSFTITVTRSGGAESGVSNSFVVNAASAARFDVEATGGGPIGAQTAGVSFNIRITARDANGNVATGFNGVVDVSSNRAGSAGLTTTAPFTNGVLASHSVTLTEAGAGATLTAHAGTETGTSNAFTVNPGGLHHFRVEIQGGGAIPAQTAGAPFAIRVTAQDQFDNTVTGFSGTVDITSTGSLTAGGGTSPAFTGGVLASRSVTIGNTGTFTITATRSGGSETGTSNSFVVSSGALHHFLVEASGGGAIPAQTAGIAFAVRITAQDAANNTVATFTGTVDVTSNRAGSAGLTTSAAFSGGVLASHSITLTQAGGGATITATRTGGAETGTSNSFAVNSGPVHHFVVESSAGGGIPAQTAGAAFTIRVIAQDQFNNTATDFTGTVGITSTGTLTAGGGTTAAFSAGVLASHSVTIANNGTFTITATRTGGSESGTSSSFVVSSGALHHFLVEASGGGAIGTQTAGAPFTIRITAQDQFNNVATGFTGTVDITSTGTLAAGGGTSAAFAGGVLASHSVTIANTGTFTITATRTGGTETGTSISFVVNAGALHHFLVEATGGGPIQTQIAGTPFGIRVTAQDAGNNTVTSFTGTVNVSSNRTGSAGLTTSAAFTAGVLSNHSVTLTQAGSGATITATRTGGTEAGTSNGFTVNVGALHHFLVEIQGGGAIPAQTAGAPFAIRVTAQDQANNTVTGFTGTVDISSTGTLAAGGGTSAAFVAGVLASHSVTIGNTGTFTITATRTGGAEGGTSNSFVVSSGVLHHFLVEATGGGPIATQTAGAPFAIRVTAQDAGNNTVTSFTGTVNVSSNRAGSAGLTTSASFSAGVLASHSITLTQAGTGATITVTRTGGSEAGTSNAFTVNVGALHHFLVESQGSGTIPAQTAGTPFAIRVTAQDQLNNTVTGFTGTVDITSTGTLSAGGGTTAAFAAGVLASHSLTVANTGTFTITATRTGGTETGTSNSFVVAAGALHHFLVEATGGGPIQTQIAGTPFGIRVTAQDAGNNTVTSFTGTVNVTSNRTGTTGLTTSAAFTAGVLPNHSVTLTQAGTGATITATRTGGAETGTSNAFTVNPGALHHFLVESAGGGSIPTQTAGAPFNIRITARDQADNTVTGFTGTVTITSTGSLTSGSGTTAAFSAGVLASHSVTIGNTGTFTITATRTGGSESGTSNAFVVSAGVLHHFLVEATGGGPIATQTAGVAFGIRVTAQDAGNNTVTTFTGTVDVTSNRTGSSGIATSAAFTAGVLSNHSITLTQAGAGATITVTRTGGTETGTSTSFLVNAGAVHHFVVESSAGGAIPTQTAGAPFTIRVTAQDQFNNTATGFTGTVGITSTGALTAGGGTTAAFSAGVLASHSVTIGNTGTFTITATRTGGTETGTSNSFVVNAGALHHFLVESAAGGPIPTQTAGVAFSIRVTAQDAGNNTVTSFTGTVDVTSNRTGSAGLTTSAAFTAGVLSSHSVTLTQAGTGATITATRTGGAESGTSAPFTVNAAALDHFTVEAQGGGPIATQTAGVAFNIRITARDQFANTATSFTGTVNVTSNRTGSLGLTTSAAFTAGVLASHSVTLTQAGAGATITATRTGGTETGTSNTFTVNAGPLHHFLVEAQGGGPIVTQTAAVPFSIQVTAQDQFANTVTSFTGTVDITSTGTLTSGGGTSAAFVAGVLASHSVTIGNTGTFTITATRTGGTETGSSNAFVVNAGPLHHFLVEAAAGGPIPAQTAGVSFNVRITAQDAGNNTVTAFTGTVDVTSNRTGTAGLTTSAAFTAGVLATHAITLTQAGAGATITVTRTGGTETGTSNAFTVNPGPVTHFIVESAAGGPIATQLVNAPFSIRITAEDQFNNIATQFSGPGNTVDITSTGTLSAGGGTTAAFSSGVLASHSVTFSNTGHFTITATRTGGTESGTSNAFDVVPPPSVTTTNPVAGATDVPLNATITINFNRSVSATTSSFTIQCPAGSTSLAYSLSASPSASYTLTPAAPLPAGELCAVTAVAAQITDAFGFHPTGDFTFSFTTRFHANDDLYPQTVIGNVGINSANIPFSVATNDTIGTGATITFVGFGATPGVSENGGTVTMTASGAGRGQFTYNPPTGFDGTDHFTYTVTQGALTSSATVTLTVSGMIWFIDDNTGSCTTTCDGRLSNPFTTLAAFQAVNDGVGNHPRAGNSIFLYQSATPYIAPVTLLTNQKLIGQDATVSLATLFGTTPPSGSAPFPVMNSGDATTTQIAGAAGGVTLASGANAFIHGLTIATTAGTALSSGATFGTLTFADGTTETPDVTINATGGGAISLTSGAVSGVTANVSSSAGTNALNLQTLTGSLVMSGGALSGATGATVNIVGGTANLTYSGTVTQSLAASVLNVTGRTGGTATLAGNLTCNTACTGISITGNSGGTVAFTGTSQSVSTGTNTAVTLSSNTGAATRFTGGALAITTTTATAFSEVTGGSTVVTGTNNTISTGSLALLLSGGSIGAEGMTFQSVSSTGGANNISITNGVSGGALTINGGAVSGAASSGIDINNASIDVAYAGTLSSSVTGFSIQNYSGTATFSGASKTISSGASRGVILTSNAAGTIRFTNGGLAITTTTANGFDATGSGGTVSVSGTGNTLTSTTGTALNFQNSTSGGLTFQSISAAGGANGIVYNTAGTGGLTVTGNGGRCDAGLATCTGGTINGSIGANGATAGIGVYLNNSSNVTLKKMRVTGTHQNFGIFGSSMSGVTLDTLLLNGTFGTAANEAAAAFDELSGSALVRGSTFAPAGGSSGDNVRVRNTTSITLNRITFDRDTIGFTGNAGINALYLIAQAGTFNATVQNSLLRGGKQKGTIFTDTLTASSDWVFTGNNVQQGTAGVAYGTPIGSAFQITTSGGTTATYTISGNTWTNLLNGANAALAIFAGQTGAGLSGSATGTIVSNSIGASGVANSGSRSISVDLEMIGSGTHQARYTDNSVFEYGDNAFNTTVGGDGTGQIAPRFDLTFARNTIKEPRAGAGVLVGTALNIGLLAGGNSTMCLNFGQGTGNLNDVNASSNVDIPFIVAASTAASGAILKLVGYPGGPDPASDPNTGDKVNTTIRAGILNSTLDGLVDLSGADQVGSDTAPIGRTCSLATP